MTVLVEVPSTYQRQQYIGGSDIAGILNVSPWATPVSVWDRKMQSQEPRVSTGKKKLYQRGKIWEQVVGSMLVAQLEAEEFEVEVMNASKRYVDPAVPFFAAEIDYELAIKGLPGVINCELKTVHPNAAKEWGDPDDDEVAAPVQYLAQCQWGLGVTGRQVCILAPLFGADSVSVYVVKRDDEIIAGMRDQALAFWNNHVVPKVPPEPRTLSDVAKLFKIDGEKELIADENIIRAIMRYQAIEAEIVAREAERDSIEFDLKCAMRDATSIVHPGVKKALATWKTRNSSRLDQEAFKQTYPKLYRQFLRESSTRAFSVSKFNLLEISHHGGRKKLTEQ
jgi:putative phage-type endonuclease